MNFINYYSFSFIVDFDVDLKCYLPNKRLSLNFDTFILSEVQIVREHYYFKCVFGEFMVYLNLNLKSLFIGILSHKFKWLSQPDRLSAVNHFDL